ncbi:MAG: hypothetical protein AVDCRST_MAG49-104, partial [uncultured Thermomicrobiales bacterium]
GRPRAATAPAGPLRPGVRLPEGHPHASHRRRRGAAARPRDERHPRVPRADGGPAGRRGLPRLDLDLGPRDGSGQGPLPGRDRPRRDVRAPGPGLEVPHVVAAGPLGLPDPAGAVHRGGADGAGDGGAPGHGRGRGGAQAVQHRRTAPRHRGGTARSPGPGADGRRRVGDGGGV